MRIRNPVGLLGMVGGVAFGAIGSFAVWDAGPDYVAGAMQPVATAAAALARPFTTAPTLYSAGSDRTKLTFWLFLVASVVCACVFALAYWLRTRPDQVRGRAQDTTLLLVQLATALFALPDLLYFVSIELPLIAPRRLAWHWQAAVVSCAVTVKLPYLFNWFGVGQFSNVSNAIINIGLQSFMLMVAFGIGSLIASERNGRAIIGRAHAELQATQQLLTEAVRASERLRIARDLHDAIGHKLTALNLHLELAALQPAGGQDGAIAVAHGLARGLLADVRAVVDVERRDADFDLRTALTTLCKGIPVPQVVLRFGVDVTIHSPAAAQAIFYAVQEAITNAMRHARASQMQVSVDKAPGLVRLTITDNGQGAPGHIQGNGLRGTAERVEALGGQFQAGNAPAGGFALAMSIPLPC